ncbi:Nn.00g083330.m01.CDS01 [Neocucurbitaria sp. VM-36]
MVFSAFTSKVYLLDLAKAKVRHRNHAMRASCFGARESFMLAVSSAEEEVRSPSPAVWQLCISALFVNSLEQRIRELEEQQLPDSTHSGHAAHLDLAVDLPEQCTPQSAQVQAQILCDATVNGPGTAGRASGIVPGDSTTGVHPALPAIAFQSSPVGAHSGDDSRPGLMPPLATASPSASIQGVPVYLPPNSQNTLAENLKSICLAAMAEPFLGSMAGLSFAKLTQAVLRRLAPDGRDFVFNHHFDGSAIRTDGNATSNLDFLSDMYLGYDEAINFSWLTGDATGPMSDALFSTETTCLPCLPEKSEVLRLAMFYFDHSHTLYPIVNRQEVMSDLQRIQTDQEHLITQSPPSMFRIWMILAIGSTAHSSITLSEELTSQQYYEKAMTYFEPSMEYGDINALEAVMLQVSFSFFNQMGPNTWFLVGTAARLALGMGLHCDAAYQHLSKLDVARRKRLFVSIYMMDRLVSITLGRPFALHEDDIEIMPFTFDTCDGLDNDPGAPQSSLCQPPLAITTHILRLRRIASDIATKVYCKRIVSRYSATQRQQILKSIHQDLVEWRQSVPFPLPDLHPLVPQGCNSWYDLNFFTHLIALYRPSPLFPTLDVARVNILAEAAAMALRHANSMHMQKRLAFNWLNMLVIYNAVIALVYSVTVQPDNIATTIERSRVVEHLELATDLFKILSHKFPAANMLGTIVAQIIDRYKSMSSNSQC